MPEFPPSLRLLPWVTPEGKPCYLSTDEGLGGRVSRLADDLEDAQLGAGLDMLVTAGVVLNDPVSPHAELRYAGMRLAECLADALRIAESRAARIPLPEQDADRTDR